MSIPVLPDAPEIRLCRGLMLYLAGLELVAWREDQAYGDLAAAPAAGFLLSFPSSPDRILTATPYGVTDLPDEKVSRTGVQLRTRWAGGNVRGVVNYSGALFDALHGLSGVTLPGGVRLSQALRTSSGSMGQDAAKRWTWTDNYSVDYDRVTV